MIIGIMSDTHDHLDNLNKALALFEEKGVGHIIHAGDFTSPFTYFRAINKFGGEFTGIFGNNDGDKISLNNVFKGRIFTQPYIFELNGRKIVVMHEPDVIEALAESGQFDLVVYGHTHKPVIKRVNKTLVVNPGEIAGWLYGKATAAIVNLDTMEAELLNIR